MPLGTQTESMRRGRRTKQVEPGHTGRRMVLMTFQIEETERNKAVDSPVNVSDYLRSCIYKLNSSAAINNHFDKLQASALEGIEPRLEATSEAATAAT